MPCLWALYLFQNVYCSVRIVIIASLFVFHYDIFTNHVRIASYCYMGYKHVLCMEGGRVISRDVDFILQGHLALFDCAKPHPCQEARQREAPDDSSRSRRTGSHYNRGWPSKFLNWLLHVFQTSLNHVQPAGKRMVYFERESILINPSPIILSYLWQHDDSMWHAWHEMPGEIETTLVVRTRLGQRTSVT